jgi:hypothetical protein
MDVSCDTRIIALLFSELGVCWICCPMFILVPDILFVVAAVDGGARGRSSVGSDTGLVMADSMRRRFVLLPTLAVAAAGLRMVS